MASIAAASEASALTFTEVDFYIYHQTGARREDAHAALTTLLEQWMFSSQEELSEFVLRVSATAPQACTPEFLRQTRVSLSGLESQFSVELMLLPSSIRSSNGTPQIAVFDLDSTLIAAEVIDELARSIGVMPAIAAITERAMNGEIDFAESLRLRVSLLKGVEVPKVWDELKARIQFMPGARDLCRALSRLGVKMAVFSGGFIPMAIWVAEQLGLERVAANQLVSSPPTSQYPFEHLTGELDPKAIIITAERKREFVKAFAAEHGVSLSRTMCVGDGANDLLMLGEVWQHGGLAVAFRAKEKVQKEAGNRYNGGSLKDLLFLFGKTAEEVRELTTQPEQAIPEVLPKLMPGLRL